MSCTLDDCASVKDVRVTSDPEYILANGVTSSPCHSASCSWWLNTDAGRNIYLSVLDYSVIRSSTNEVNRWFYFFLNDLRSYICISVAPIAADEPWNAGVLQIRSDQGRRWEVRPERLQFRSLHERWTRRRPEAEPRLHPSSSPVAGWREQCLQVEIPPDFIDSLLFTSERSTIHHRLSRYSLSFSDSSSMSLCWRFEETGRFLFIQLD